VASGVVTSDTQPRIQAGVITNPVVAEKKRRGTYKEHGFGRNRQARRQDLVGRAIVADQQQLQGERDALREVRQDMNRNADRPQEEKLPIAEDEPDFQGFVVETKIEDASVMIISFFASLALTLGCHGLNVGWKTRWFSYFALGEAAGRVKESKPALLSCLIGWFTAHTVRLITRSSMSLGNKLIAATTFGLGGLVFAYNTASIWKRERRTWTIGRRLPEVEGDTRSLSSLAVGIRRRAAHCYEATKSVEQPCELMSEVKEARTVISKVIAAELAKNVVGSCLSDTEVEAQRQRAQRFATLRLSYLRPEVHGATAMMVVDYSKKRYSDFVMDQPESMRPNAQRVRMWVQLAGVLQLVILLSLGATSLQSWLKSSATYLRSSQECLLRALGSLSSSLNPSQLQGVSAHMF
jgi:hypothetical protein